MPGTQTTLAGRSFEEGFKSRRASLSDVSYSLGEKHRQSQGRTQSAGDRAPRIPRKQFDAVMGGAKAVMRELTEFAEQAKSRLREDRPIKQDDLLELLRKLVAAQKRIDAEMEADVANSADTGDTEWDRRSYNLFAVPTSRMANSPQTIVDLTLAAENNGARDMKLLYELTVAEMEVAVARFNVTLNSIPEEGTPRLREPEP
jgi:hypothetical protein